MIVIEEWKDIEGFCGLYQVSNLGRVRSCDRTIIGSDGVSYFKRGSIKLPQNGNGRYFVVWLYKGNKGVRKRIHRLVAEAFIENPEGKEEVDHIDTDTHNNVFTNLRWVTRSENLLNSVTRLKRCTLLDGRIASEIAKENGISFGLMCCRLHRGWSVKDACTRPVKGALKCL